MILQSAVLMPGAGYAADSMEQLLESLVQQVAPKFAPPEPPSNQPWIAGFAPHSEQAQDYWSLSGLLRDATGGEFGVRFELVRAGLRAPISGTPPASAWRAPAVYLASLDLTDLRAKRRYDSQRLSREALGLSGAVGEPVRIWVEDWQVRTAADNGDLQLYLPNEFGLLDLRIPVRAGLLWPPSGNEMQGLRTTVVTRLPASANWQRNGQSLALSGPLWLDRAWGQIPLRSGVMTVERLQLQLDDGRDLNLSVLRRREGQARPVVRGTLIDRQGLTQELTGADTRVDVLATRTDAAAGVAYPVAWRVESKTAHLDLAIRTVLPASTGRATGSLRAELVQVDPKLGGGAGYVQRLGFSDGR